MASGFLTGTTADKTVASDLGRHALTVRNVGQCHGLSFVGKASQVAIPYLRCRSLSLVEIGVKAHLDGQSPLEMRA